MTKKKIYQIVIEGHNAKEVEELFEEIQNKYDNCVLEIDEPKNTIIDKDRYEETGRLHINKSLVKRYGE